MLKSTLAALAVAAALLVMYNGHAGYQHNQTDPEFLALSPQGQGLTDISDGTSNTLFFGIAADGRGADFVGMPDMGGQYHRTMR